MSINRHFQRRTDNEYVYSHDSADNKITDNVKKLNKIKKNKK